MTRVLIMAGGTGGHVFPALALADELRSRSIDVSWIGTALGIEAKLVPAAGIVLSEITIKGLRGNGMVGWLLAPLRLLKAIWQSRQIIKQLQPDVVIGLGGFVSGPGGFTAWLMRKPLVLHEQNAIPGLTNRLLSKIANRVLEGFPGSFDAKTNATWVGNPVRESIETLAEPATRLSADDKPINLLILGGSLGAKSLNTFVPEALASLAEVERPHVKHQCGAKHINDCRENYQQANVEAEVSQFIDDMAAAYAWADLVICRSGALTVAELAAAGVASVLVPYPYAVDDHQTKNASLLFKQGAAELMPDAEMNAANLAATIERLIKNKKGLLDMANAARQVAKLGTAKQIADICLELADG